MNLQFRKCRKSLRIFISHLLSSESRASLTYTERGHSNDTWRSGEGARGATKCHMNGFKYFTNFKVKVITSLKTVIFES